MRFQLQLFFESKTRISGNNRYFDRTKLVDCAVQSGKNLASQLAYFESVNSDTKPLLIVQGNCLETASIWVENMYKQIPKDLQANIGGVAFGSPCIGTGALEEVEKSCGRTTFHTFKT